jgi:prepilin-type N-terminal cleavage/methylation domain-containing protein
MVFVKKSLKGFSIVELIIAVAIIAIITAVIVYGQSQFNQTVKLNNAAQQLALFFRQQQSNAINVISSDATSFNHGYGVVFNNPVGAPQIDVNQYKRFLDAPNSNRVYDGMMGSNCGGVPCDDRWIDTNWQNFFAPPFKVTSICYVSTQSGNPYYCSNSSPPVRGSSLSYSRPFIEPNHYTRIGGAVGQSSSGLIAMMYLVVEDTGSGKQRFVVLDQSGQIYVTSTRPNLGDSDS